MHAGVEWVVRTMRCNIEGTTVGLLWILLGNICCGAVRWGGVGKKNTNSKALFWIWTQWRSVWSTSVSILASMYTHGQTLHLVIPYHMQHGQTPHFITLTVLHVSSGSKLGASTTLSAYCNLVMHASQWRLAYVVWMSATVLRSPTIPWPTPTSLQGSMAAKRTVYPMWSNSCVVGEPWSYPKHSMTVLETTHIKTLKALHYQPLPISNHYTKPLERKM